MVLLTPPLTYGCAITTGLSVEASIFACLMLATLLLWVHRLVDEFVAPLVAIVGSLFVGLAPPKIALSGFASPSMLLLVGIFALSATISASGLSYRLILQLLIRLPDQSRWHQLTLLGAGYLLSPIVPSANTRVALLTPAYKSIVDALRLPRGGMETTALLAALFSGSRLFGPMMATSRSFNIAAIGFLPPQLQIEFNGLFWLVAALAALAVVTSAHLLITPRLFPEGHRNPLLREDLRQTLIGLGKLSTTEWTAALCFLLFALGSATTSWHHLEAHVLAGCVLLALLISGTMQKKDFRRSIDWPQIFFLMGIDSMVKIMDYLGLQESLAATMQNRFDFIHGNIILFIAVALIVTIAMRLALPVTAGAISATVILLPIAQAQSINPWIVVFCATMFTDITFFRYQGTNGLLQLYSDGVIDDVNEGRFLAHVKWINIAIVAAVLASIPWWNALDIL